MGDMPGSSFGIALRSMTAPRPGVCATASGTAFDKPPAPTSWISRIGFWVQRAELHRGEIEIRARSAAAHVRGRATTETDQHRRPAEHHDLRTHGNVGFLDVLAPHVAHAASDHDGFVISARAIGVIADRRLLEAAEVAADVRPAEFVVEGG